MGIFNNYEPQKVLNYFEDICKIPRPSGEEKEISDYIVEFAKNRGLRFYQDELFNVIVYKDAIVGMENKDTIILQAHIDMVAVADDDYDFSRGVKPYVENGYIKAKGTTLGADDGIGVAYMLAILDSDDIAHPSLECVFTTSEEVGLDGASGLDLTKLSGKKLINLDSENENDLVIGCAGGCRSEMSFDYEPVLKDGLAVKLTIEGLEGGHSGVEIHKGRANANILLGRILCELCDKLEFSLVNANGGTKDNAITTKSEALIIIDSNDMEILEKSIANNNDILKKEYHITDTRLNVGIETQENISVEVLSDVDFARVMVLMNCSSYGPIKMRQGDLNSVETSMNLGILKIDRGNVSVCHSVRSNIESGKEWQKNRLRLLANSVNADIVFSGEYPAWESIGVSSFALHANLIYKRLFGKEFKIFTEHAGLECALFCSKDKEIQAISIGPNLENVHTTSESASIVSIEKMWKYLIELLKG